MSAYVRQDIRVEIIQGMDKRTPEELEHTIERINAAGFQEWERLALVQHIEWVKLLKEQKP